MEWRSRRARAAAWLAAAVSLASSGAGAQEDDARASLVLDAGWEGHVVIDRLPPSGGRPVPVRELSQRATESRFLVLPPGRYRVFHADCERPIPVTVVELAAGRTAVVGRSDFRPLAADEPRMVRPPAVRVSYPRTAAARPLTLPAVMGEATLGFAGLFRSDRYDSTSLELVRSRVSITDRIELRGVGIYGAILPRRPRPPGGGSDLRPELAAGVGVGSLLAFGLLGISDSLLGVDAAIDLKEHLHRAVALQLGLWGGVHSRLDGTTPDVLLGAALSPRTLPFSMMRAFAFSAA